MKVLVWPGDTGGSGFHRVRLPAAICKENGIDLEVLNQVPARRQDDGEYKILTQGIEADVLVIQRPLYKYVVDAIPEFQKDGIAVVVELDDDLEAITKNHMAYEVLDPKKSPYMNWAHLRRATETCDLLTCATKALADKYGKEGRTVVISNYMPKEITEIDLMGPLHTVGWTSNVETHPNDLQQTKGGVAAAVIDEKAALYIVGDPKNVARNLGCPGDIEVKSPGWVDHFEYYFYIRAAKVGIVPLEPGPFNEAKSHLKGIEFAAVGVPFIASPTQEYINLANKGAGTLASTGPQWYAATREYLSDPIYRSEMGRQARETIKNHYLLEDHWHEYPEAWEKALNLTRGT